MENQPTNPAPKAHSAVPAQSAPPEEKKALYSRNARPAQQFEGRMSKSAHRVSKAVERGLQNYLDEREKSLERLRDGALLESYVNVASGISEGLAEASPALKDVAKAFNTKRTRRLLRSVVRSIPFPR